MHQHDTQLQELRSLLSLFGPQFVRTKSFWQALVYAVVIGILLGVVALLFFNLFEESAHLMWNTDEYQEHIKLARNHSKAQQQWGVTGKWWYVSLCSGGGLAVGSIKLLWSSMRPTPFPKNPPSLVIEVKDLHVHDPPTALPIMLCSAVGLACGCSVGPEAALGAVGGAIGTVLGPHFVHSSDSSDCSDKSRLQLYVVIAMTAAFGPLLPSPVLAVMMMHELGFATDAKPTAPFMEVVLLTGVASSVSYVLFVGLEGLTFLKVLKIPPFELATMTKNWIPYYAHACWLGVLCGVGGLIGIGLLGLGKKMGSMVSNLLDRIHVHLGMLLTPCIGGMVIGLIARWMPMTLGDGNAQLEIIVLNGLQKNPALSPSFFLVLGLCKMVALGVSLGFGFVGGQIFPLIFAGACLGTAMAQMTGLSAIFTLPCAMVALPCAFTPVIFSLVSMVSVLMALGGEATGPVFIASIFSYGTVCGLGVVQRAISRQIDQLDGASIVVESAAGEGETKEDSLLGRRK